MPLRAWPIVQFGEEQRVSDSFFTKAFVLALRAKQDFYAIDAAPTRANANYFFDVKAAGFLQDSPNSFSQIIFRYRTSLNDFILRSSFEKPKLSFCSM